MGTSNRPEMFSRAQESGASDGPCKSKAPSLTARRFELPGEAELASISHLSRVLT